MFATIPPTNSLKFLFSFIFFWKSLSFLTPFPWERLMGPPWAATAQQWRDFSSSWNSGSLGAGARFGAGGSLRAGAPNMFSGSGPGYGGAPPSGPQGAPRTTSDPWGKVMLNQTFLPLLKCNVALCHVVVVFENDSCSALRRLVNSVLNERKTMYFGKEGITWIQTFNYGSKLLGSGTKL